MSSVILGLPGELISSADLIDHRVTKVGGHPVFCRIPPHCNVACKLCSGPLSLVLQVIPGGLRKRLHCKCKESKHEIAILACAKVHFSRVQLCYYMAVLVHQHIFQLISFTAGICPAESGPNFCPSTRARALFVLLQPEILQPFS